MPAVAEPYQVIEKGQLTEDENGIVESCTYLVTGIDPMQPSPMYQALRAINLPDWGQSHPVIPDLKVRSRIVAPFARNSKTDAFVTLQYRSVEDGPWTSQDQPVVRFHGFTRELPTFKYPDGTLIEATYKPPNANTPVTQRQQVVCTKAFGLLTFDYVTNRNPEWMTTYMNKLNDQPWRRGAKYTWHSIELGIEKQKGRPGWLVHWGFAYDEETHIKTAFWRHANGSIPADIPQRIDPYSTVTNLGYANVAPANAINFQMLGLPTGF